MGVDRGTASRRITEAFSEAQEVSFHEEVTLEVTHGQGPITLVAHSAGAGLGSSYWILEAQRPPNLWEKNLQGLKSWVWLPKFCTTFGFLYEGSPRGFLQCEAFY